jgi:hypothetical protein
MQGAAMVVIWALLITLQDETEQLQSKEQVAKPDEGKDQVDICTGCS